MSILTSRSDDENFYGIVDLTRDQRKEIHGAIISMKGIKFYIFSTIEGANYIKNDIRCSITEKEVHIYKIKKKKAIHYTMKLHTVTKRRKGITNYVNIDDLLDVLSLPFKEAKCIIRCNILVKIAYNFC